MKKKTFIVPCLVVVQNVDTISEAVMAAQRFMEPNGDAFLFIDEGLPTVTMKCKPYHLPKSLTEVPALDAYFAITVDKV
jgi:hypothetical protein